MRVIVLYGDTETGKSWAAGSMAPDAYKLPPQQSSTGCGWWDAYDGESSIIIDEYYGWLRWSFLLQLLDRYSLRVETKGGSCQFVGKEVIFTSNKPPWHWYDREKIPEQGPLRRRLTAIYHCEKDLVTKVVWPAVVF